MADEVEQEEEGGLRSQMWKHEAMVQWINETEDVNLDELSAAYIIAFAFAKRVAWRKSDTYKELVAGRAEQVAAEKAERAAARKAEQEAKAAEKAAAKAAKAEKADKEPAKATKATKATKGTGKATKATKASKGKAAASDENPFD